MIQIVGEQRFDTLMTRLAQLSQQIQAQLHVRCADQLAGRLINVVFSNHFTCDVLNRNFDQLDVVFFQLANMARSNAAAFFYVHFTVSFDVKRCGFTTQAFRHQFHLQLVITDFKDNFFKEQVEDLLCGVVQGTQNDCRR
ncbi:hypothetical protein ExPCM15_01308 [Escherichia coli]|nr:hypothetical protein ExPCM15_01308 [Escherichia coli]